MKTSSTRILTVLSRPASLESSKEANRVVAPPGERSLKKSRIAEDIQSLITSRETQKWRTLFQEEVPYVTRWAASLDGEILFREGGSCERLVVGEVLDSEDPGHSGFFSAVGALLKKGAPESMVQLTAVDEHSPCGVRKKYVCVYSLLRKASGRPYAVAVTTTDITCAEERFSEACLQDKPPRPEDVTNE